MKATSALTLDFETWWRTFLEVERLYPHVLPLTLWRAWELALYRRYTLPETVLDLGCGDGRFFRQIWRRPPLADGVDFDEEVTHHARWVGIYRHVVAGAAQALPFADQSYAAVFSNCAFEHMSDIDRVLSEAARVLRPGGVFLFSVMTDKTVAWEMMKPLTQMLGVPERGSTLWHLYEAFHHLVNPLPKETWLAKLEAAGFAVVDAWPILPEPFARVFMLLDELWHLPDKDEQEWGNTLHTSFQQWPHYAEALRPIFQGLWALSPPHSSEEGAGLVVYARRKPVAVGSKHMAPSSRRCWCGSHDLVPASAVYDRCLNCGTLVARAPIVALESPSSEEERDNRSTPVLQAVDLALAHRPPPAQALLIGLNSGTLLERLLTGVGYTVRAVPALEASSLAQEEADVVVLAHTVEYAPDPVTYVRRAAQLLRPQGVLLIQAFCRDEPSGWDDLPTPAKPRFVFTPKALERLLARLSGQSALGVTPCWRDTVWGWAARPSVEEAASPVSSESAVPQHRADVLSLLSAHLQRREAEVRHLESVVGHYEEVLRQWQTCTKEVARRQTAIDQCMAELDGCAQTLAKSTEDQRRCQQEREHCQAELERSQAELERSHAELEHCQAELERSQAEREVLVQTLSHTRGQIRVLAAALQDSVVYRLLRRAGRWEGIEQILRELSRSWGQ